VEKPKKAKRTAGGGAVELAGPEEQLFQALRAWRRELASERGVPPYVILTDATLIELARERPASHVALMAIKGIGESKARSFGEQLLVLLADHSANLGLAQAEGPATLALPDPEPPAPARVPAGQQQAAFTAFRKGLGLEDVAALTGRAASTVEGYLLEFIKEEGVRSPEPWLSRAAYDQVVATAHEIKAERLRPIHEALGGALGYGEIRIALAILANQH
jgi:ATP-dependent DNA helicase RecQ